MKCPMCQIDMNKAPVTRTNSIWDIIHSYFYCTSDKLEYFIMRVGYIKDAIRTRTDGWVATNKNILQSIICNKKDTELIEIWIMKGKVYIITDIQRLAKLKAFQ